MRASGGVVAIVAGSGVALLVVFGLWHRLAPAVSLPLLAACGALVGAGALMVQGRPGPGDWVIALMTLGVLTPVHARLVFGRPGVRR